jgi:SMC interacting uncharacterized protein involved in chromosome segregation
VTTDQGITLLGVLLSAGLASFVTSQWRAWRARHRARQEDTADRRHMTEIDGSLLTVVRARDELEDDNRRLREQLAEERRMRAEDQARHERERNSMRAEMDRLEDRLRELLLEVQDLKLRATS